MSETIYHLALSSDWKQSQQKGAYCAESLEQEGFIHCSQWEQVKPVFARFYSATSGLWLLKVDVDILRAEVVYENTEGGIELFPHVYGPINLEAVVSVHPLVSDTGEMNWPEENSFCD